MDFEWDYLKAAANLRKHGISFEEAASVWDDLNSLEVYDEVHSDDEDRFWRIGFSERTRMLTVVYCARGVDTVRIISARRAERSDRLRYERGIP
jgi:uncharacterized DUF497 family protein